MINKIHIIVILIALDMIITVPYWHLESNPIAISIGIHAFILHHIISVIALGLIIIGWPKIMDHKIANFCLCFLIGVYGFAVISNLWVIL